jgi:glycosyltransferase involved in cell wall biosynthesis
MNSPLVSCIVPVFNGERYLGEALDSILKQIYRQLEIIVVDDGSTDTTPTVAARYRERLLYVRQDNAGAPTARNLGLSLARGEFVAFLDADDLWRPEKLQRQMRQFEGRPELDVSVTYLQNFWVAELKKEETRFKGHRLSEPVPGYVTQTLLARRSAFDSVGLFNESLKVGDPTDWFLRATEQGLVTEMLRDVLVDRRMHESNTSMQPGTRRMTPPMEESMLWVVKASLDRRRLAHQG